MTTTNPSTSGASPEEMQEVTINPVSSEQEIVTRGEGFVIGVGHGRINMRATGPGLGISRFKSGC